MNFFTCIQKLQNDHQFHRDFSYSNKKYSAVKIHKNVYQKKKHFLCRFSAISDLQDDIISYDSGTYMEGI